MLDRIINIKTDLNYKGSKYSGPATKYRNVLPGKMSINDTISFSPAVHYLARINWRLKEIIGRGKETVKIIFLVGEFEFQAEIDLVRFNSQSRQFFDIIKNIQNAKNKEERIILTVSVGKDNYSLRDDIQVLELNGLRKLFQRIAYLEVANEISKFDSIALKDLMDEINFNIIREFEYINTAFFTLVEKLIPEKSLQGHKFEEQVEPVIIEKIKVLANE